MPTPQQTSTRPGRIFIKEVRKVGRQKNCGSIAWIDGHMVVCIGYSEDGLTAAYATPEQINAIKRSLGKAKRSLMHLLLTRLISHYENKAA